MIEYRERVLAQLDGRTLGRVSGGSLQLVTVCLTDEGAGEICDEHGQPLPPTLPVFAYLRPDEARALAFCLLEVAELAEQRSS
ncbi:MAG TPA: hypothetical protein VHM72_07760 [Solirubrobacteraceae bacterium]|jgi:hypothetical protein|nr:hypothetical protein [Solirubrobacteraceae bacterium]